MSKREVICDSCEKEPAVCVSGAKISQAIRKLTDAQELEIARRLMAGEMVKTLAGEFSMHRTSISKIKMAALALVERERQWNLFAEAQQ